MIQKMVKKAYPTNTLAMSSTEETRNRVHAIAFILLDQMLDRCSLVNFKWKKVMFNLAVTRRS